MQPIGQLMREHRTIEKLVESLHVELDRVRQGKMNSALIDTAVDFFRTYADRTHHGKEENILFRDLTEKPLTPELRSTMSQLIEEHKTARATVSGLIDAKDRYLRGEETALGEVASSLDTIIHLYPAHIEKEDKHFFYPVMEYFSASEQEAMLDEFNEFDRNMIHEKYGGVVDDIKKLYGRGQMRCKVCGYVYDPSVGDVAHGVKEGTPFEDLPESWTCPVCDAPKSMFEKA